jgi:hypothetical protein
MVGGLTVSDGFDPSGFRMFGTHWEPSGIAATSVHIQGDVDINTAVTGYLSKMPNRAMNLTIKLWWSGKDGDKGTFPPITAF